MSLSCYYISFLHTVIYVSTLDLITAEEEGSLWHGSNSRIHVVYGSANSGQPSVMSQLSLLTMSYKAKPSCPSCPILTPSLLILFLCISLYLI